MSWTDTGITGNDEEGWWCGGQCWPSREEAEQHQTRLTKPTSSPVTRNGEVIRITTPTTRIGGILSYDTTFEVFGRRVAGPQVEAMRLYKRLKKSRKRK